MANGFVLSQEGIPVSYAADYQKVIDSRWKFLEIAFDTTIDLSFSNLLTTRNSTGVTGGTHGYNIFTILNHNLGYLPYFEYEILPNTTTGIYSGLHDSGYNWIATIPLNPLFADNNNIYFELAYYRQNNAAPNTYTGTIRLNVRVKVYAVNLILEYSAPTLNSIGSKSFASSKTGVKMLRGNLGTIGGMDLRNFSTNTTAKTISIQKTGTAVTPSSGPLVITHNAGYPPSFLMTQVIDRTKSVNPYSGSAGYNTDATDYPLYNTPIILPGDSTIYSSHSDNYQLTVGGVQAALSGYFSYIILKDPAEIAQ
jgi:hypothetical protein